MTPSAGASPLSRFHLGTSSFSAKEWVGPFYPEGTRPADFLEHYATRFGAVEVDATYYRVPSERMVDAWRRNTPDGFLLCAKFPRDIVHGGEKAKPDPRVVLLPETTYEVRDRFLEVMSRLGGRLGPLVLQFPYYARDVFASKREFMDRLDRFLGDLPEGFSYGVEIRNRAWLTPDFAGMLRGHNAAMVLVDQAWMPHGDEVEKAMDPVTADFAYIRLLGDRKEIEAITRTWEKEVIDRGERLQRWAGLITRLLDREVPTHVYVNNHYAGHAPATARRLREMVEAILKR